ncbi:GatB/YqeY domain-containing protein [Candidatus Gottesmanbacteria bacterium]|nr:GatB/YqeY domain-containing protein [Candidatus Gottesmanbacteria bacterium]
MLREQIKEQMLASLKDHDKAKVETLRFLLAGIQQAAIAKYGNLSDSKLSDADVLDVIKKQVKSHKESIFAFKEAKRAELVEKETQELAMLEAYLPSQISDEKLIEMLSPIVQSGEKNFGLLMKLAMEKVAGKADGSRVSLILKSLIQK